MTLMIGVITENKSDEDVTLELLRKLATKRFGVKSFHSRGCGKLKSKCVAWAEDLYTRGCRALIVVQDLDANDLAHLRNELQSLLDKTRFDLRVAAIPIREIEAWLLSDEDAIRSAMSLRAPVAATTSPELEVDAKQRLRRVIGAASSPGRRVDYLNTIHNKRIAHCLNPGRVLAKCPSFAPLREFAISHLS